MHKPVKQHYVPQVYLRFFALKREKIWETCVIDKKNNTTYFTDVKNVAFEKNFYTVDKLGDKKYVFEEYYSKQIEPLISQTFKRFIQECTLIFTKDRGVVINREFRTVFSKIIITQLLRTPKARAHQHNVGADIFPFIIKETIKGLDQYLKEDQKKYINALTINDIFKEADMEFITDPARINKFAKFIYDKIWIVYRNDNYKINPFATSDHPIVQYNVLTSDTTFEKNGIRNPDTIISFPISPQLILSVYDRNNPRFSLMEYLDGSIVFLDNVNDEKYLIEMNKLQYEQCVQHVYFKPFK